MSVTGSGPADPQRVGVPIADLLAGMYGAYGVLAALRERDRTGAGAIVRTSLLAAVIGVHGFQGTAYTVAGQVGARRGQPPPVDIPVRVVPLPGRAVQIACGSEGLWRRLCAEFDLDPEADGLRTNGDRVRSADRSVPCLRPPSAGDDPDQLLARLDRAGGPGRAGARHRRGLRVAARPPARACSFRSSTPPSAR